MPHQLPHPTLQWESPEAEVGSQHPGAPSISPSPANACTPGWGVASHTQGAQQGRPGTLRTGCSRVFRTGKQPSDFRGQKGGRNQRLVVIGQNLGGNRRQLTVIDNGWPATPVGSVCVAGFLLGVRSIRVGNGRAVPRTALNAKMGGGGGCQTPARLDLKLIRKKEKKGNRRRLLQLASLQHQPPSVDH